MLNLPQQTLAKVRNVLLRRQKEVDRQLKELDKDDPVLAQGVAESTEPGTESWQADVHNRMTALKNDLFDLSKRIRNSLMQIRQGTYGHCEKCGKHIEPERLEALPTATLCLVCSQKSSKK
ncbi:TraR/DksA C4-type zinc finger protein [Candidatus Daviesbacteria bacterium]|nr:TraR/DksA C4-type zinc finger protein [Candidatus Daviesbacteria bacterium]